MTAARTVRLATAHRWARFAHQLHVQRLTDADLRETRGNDDGGPTPWTSKHNCWPASDGNDIPQLLPTPDDLNPENAA